jgi:hypothetical protein
MIFIATAEIDEVNFHWLDALRREHFPAERNVLSAHLTMFHHLGREQMERLLKTALPEAPLPLSFTKIRPLGRGVAIDVDSPALSELRRVLKSDAHGMFTPQDSQNWRPHVTIQNKVAPAKAQALLDSLSAAFVTRDGAAIALQLWRYLDGPWSPFARRAFEPIH